MAGMVDLVERSTLPRSQKKINCPSCRRRTHASEVAYVVNSYEKEGLDPAIAQLQGGEKEDVDFASSVKGSYGTKVWKCSCNLMQCYCLKVTWLAQLIP